MDTKTDGNLRSKNKDLTAKTFGISTWHNIINIMTYKNIIHHHSRSWWMILFTAVNYIMIHIYIFWTENYYSKVSLSKNTFTYLIKEKCKSFQNVITHGINDYCGHIYFLFLMCIVWFFSSYFCPWKKMELLCLNVR